jgi:3-hydroxyisobutyrate dehydrogenase-like beta-hydroxyacid dehydrogenase
VTTIAILGLGEAGRVYARGLRGAGADVRGYDAFHRSDDPRIDQVDTLPQAVRGADVVLSVVGGAAALSVAAEALPYASPSTVWADLNTAAPGVEREIAGVAERCGVPMADVAVLAPVPRAGIRTALLASGTGAEALADRLRPLGVPIEVIPGAAGEAARLRLLRSMFMKGLAALVVEGVAAARALDAEEWLRDQIAGELGPDGRATIDRLIEGTHRHALRREHEVRDALAELERSNQPADMTRATLAWFERLNAATPDP